MTVEMRLVQILHKCQVIK